MKAFKKTVKVENHKITINLPDDFNAEKVEVIILSKDNDFVLTDEQMNTLDERIKEPEENYISAKESIDRLITKNGL